jgi:methyl-accepting chemotaxis protein
MQFIRKRTTIAFLAVLVAAAALAGGCGGSSDSGSSDTTSADTWANDFCGAFSTWTTSIQSAFDPIKSGNVSKDTLQSATTNMKDATSTFVDDVKSLGKPDTEGGQKAKDSLNTMADELSQDVDDIKETVDGISGVQGAIDAIPKIQTTAQKMGTDAQSALTDVKNADVKGELEDAIKNAPNCKKLSSG